MILDDHHGAARREVRAAHLDAEVGPHQEPAPADHQPVRPRADRGRVERVSRGPRVAGAGRRAVGLGCRLLRHRRDSLEAGYPERQPDRRKGLAFAPPREMLRTAGSGLYAQEHGTRNHGIQDLARSLRRGGPSTAYEDITLNEYTERAANTWGNRLPDLPQLLVTYNELNDKVRRCAATARAQRGEGTGWRSSSPTSPRRSPFTGRCEQGQGRDDQPALHAAGDQHQ